MNDTINSSKEQRAEERELRREIMRQWLANHDEHCGVVMTTWPHAGQCYWPLPAIILDLSSQDVDVLLHEVLRRETGYS